MRHGLPQKRIESMRLARLSVTSVTSDAAAPEVARDPPFNNLAAGLALPTNTRSFSPLGALGILDRDEAWPGEEGAMQGGPDQGDQVVPEDHEEIRQEELLALEQEIDGLKAALGTRSVIGKALGIIIEREGVNETEAFEILKGMSQHSNVKLRDVAARLTEKAERDA